MTKRKKRRKHWTETLYGNVKMVKAGQWIYYSPFGEKVPLHRNTRKSHGKYGCFPKTFWLADMPHWHDVSDFGIVDAGNLAELARMVEHMCEEHDG
jgi:hypothetical protein